MSDARGQRVASAVSLALLAAVAWPVRQNWRTQPRDGFPLSYFPMFTVRRGTRLRITHLVGQDATGGRHLIPSRVVGSGGLNQVRRQLRRTAEAGRGERLCASVAGELMRRGTPGLADLVEVRLVSCHYRLADFFTGACEPRSERVHASWRRPVA